MHTRYCGGNKHRGKWKSRSGMLHNATSRACARVRKSRGDFAWNISQLLRYIRAALSRPSARRVRYFIIFFMHCQESVLFAILTIVRAQKCKQTQETASTDATRSTPDCLPRNRTDSIRRRASELVRINLWAVSLPFTSVKRNVRIYAYLCVVYEILYEIPDAIEISKFKTA